MRLLVVEDEPDLKHSLLKALREEGYAVDGADDGEEGLFKAQTVDYDAVVLDVMLPKLDGWQLLRALRETKKTPVLMLTARGGIRDRVQGLDSGADDYLIKPFDLDELLARLRALIRRSVALADSRIEIGEVVIDFRARTVSLGHRGPSDRPRVCARRGARPARRAGDLANGALRASFRRERGHAFQPPRRSRFQYPQEAWPGVHRDAPRPRLLRRVALVILTSLRWRLQIWHGLMLVVVLAGFGVMAFRVARDGELRRIDSELEQQAMRLLRPEPRGPMRDGPPPGWGPEPRPGAEGAAGPRGGPDDRSGGPPEGPSGPRPMDVRARLREGLDRLGTDEASYVVVWESDGTLLARSASTPADMPAPTLTERRRRDGPGEVRPGPFRWQGRSRGDRRELSVLLPEGLTILAGRSIATDLAATRRLAYGLTGIGSGVLLLGLVGGVWLAARAIRPIEDISETALRIAAGISPSAST